MQVTCHNFEASDKKWLSPIWNYIFPKVKKWGRHKGLHRFNNPLNIKKGMYNPHHPHHRNCMAYPQLICTKPSSIMAKWATQIYSRQRSNPLYLIFLLSSPLYLIFLSLIFVISDNDLALCQTILWAPFYRTHGLCQQHHINRSHGDLIFAYASCGSQRLKHALAQPDLHHWHHGCFATLVAF